MCASRVLTVLLIVMVTGWSAWAGDSGRREVAQGTSGEGSPKKGKTPAKEVSPGAAKKKEPLPGVTPEREAAVMKFVEQHHAELAALLAQLKQNNPVEYERAVRDLFKTSERLAQTHERDLQRYEVELKLWQVQSRIDLLTARLQMSGGDELRGQLRQALDEQVRLRQSSLQLERDRLSERVRKLDEQIESLEKARGELVDRQVRTIAGDATKSNPANKTAPGKKAVRPARDNKKAGSNSDP